MIKNKNKTWLKNEDGKKVEKMIKEMINAMIIKMIKMKNILKISNV